LILKSDNVLKYLTQMEKTIINTIHINVSKENVWDALVNPSKTKVYMFGCETISDWKIGSD
jgi:uncharacterized protein YndB with AHSA1/START domain